MSPATIFSKEQWMAEAETEREGGGDCEFRLFFGVGRAQLQTNFEPLLLAGLCSESVFVGR
jgi:hypothetical protein